MNTTYIENVYDLMAVLCCHISAFDPKSKMHLYRQFYANPESAKLEVEKHFSFLDRRTCNELYQYDFLLPEQVDQISQAITKWSSSETDKILLLSLLIYLDTYVDFESSIDKFMLHAHSPLDGVYSFMSLNANTESVNGMLLPRFEPSWKKSSDRRRSGLTEDPLSAMQHYFWVPKIPDWNISNMFSPDWTHHEAKPYTIVCSPLINTPTFTHEIKNVNGTYYFYIASYLPKEGNLLLDRIKKVLTLAGNAGANIVLFPEILASPSCQIECQNHIHTHWDSQFPRIICLPTSEFKDNDSTWKNQLKIINDSGACITTYNKQQAFQLDMAHPSASAGPHKATQKIKAFEPIEADHHLTIIHVKGLGRIGILICADLFNPDIREILFHHYEVRLLLVMAYTPGHDTFFRELSAAQATYCDVVWCNSCAAYNSTQASLPAVAYFSYGHNKRSEKLVPRCQNKVLCDGCAITITIGSEYGTAGSVFYEKLPTENINSEGGPTDDT